MMETPYLGKVECFIEDSSFAKVITDERGQDAILVGGQIIKVEPSYLADGIVRALRRQGREADSPFGIVDMNSGISAPQAI